MATAVRSSRLIFKHPFPMMVAGPTSSGKTEFVKKLLRNSSWIIDPRPEKITWYYGAWQNWYADFGYDVEFVEGMPDVKSIESVKNKIIVIDDLMEAVNVDMAKLFTTFSHHKNASIIYLCQNVFHQNKSQRTISLNLHYITVFKNLRDARQIRTLGQQVLPDDTRFFKAAFEDATRRPYGYLLIDFKPGGDNKDAVLYTDVFPDEHQFVATYVKSM